MKMTAQDLEDDHFTRLPNEMQREVLAYLPLKSMLEARSVSSQWKAMISRNFTDFICHVTDDTYSTLGNTTEIFRTVKIFDLTGKNSKVISSSRGAGRIIGEAESLQVVGDNIDKTNLSKIMHYAAVSLEELVFRRCSVPILNSALGSAKHSFQNLSTLRINFKGPPSPMQTQFLNKLATLGESSLRVINHLSLTWTCRHGDPQMGFSRGRAKKVFENYLAVTRLVTRVRRTLKSLEITRSARVLVNLQIGLRYYTASTLQLASIEQYSEELKELKLNKLKLTLMMVEGKDPWVLENALLRCQSSVQELILNKKCITQRSFLPQTLHNLLPAKPALLTDVTLSLTIHGGDPISLRYFSQCPQLRTLGIACYCYLFSPENEWTCSVSEINELPRTLRRLRLIPQRLIVDEDDGTEGEPQPQEMVLQNLNFYRESYLILKQNQLEWIAGNLMNLQSFGCFLLAKEVEEERIIDLGLFQLPAREFNEIANMDLDLFKELVRMPKMKRVEVNILKAGQLRGFDEGIRRQIFSTVRSTAEIREYLEFCRQEENVSVETRVIPRKYVEVTVSK